MFVPPANAVLYYKFKYLFDNYDVITFSSSAYGAAKGYQIIDGTASYVGLDDGNGTISWQRVA